MVKKETQRDRMTGWMQRRGKRSGEWRVPSPVLLAFVRQRNVKTNAPLVVGFDGGRQVEIGKRDFLGAWGTETPQSLADDGVVLNLLFMLIAKNQDGGGDDRGSLRLIFQTYA